MNYGNWGDGEHPAAAHRATDSQSPDDPYRVDGRAPLPGWFRVPGQRKHRDDPDLARPYVPASGTGWSPSGGRRPELPPGGRRPELPPGGRRPELPPGGRRPELPPGGRHPELPPTGRHRELPTANDATQRRGGSASRDSWHQPSDRWRPTLDPTDWRYATGDIEFQSGYAPWEEDRWPGMQRRGSDPGDPVSGPDGPRPRGGAHWAGNSDTEQWDRPSGEWWSSDAWDSRSGHSEPPADTGVWPPVTDTGEWPGIGYESSSPHHGPADPDDRSVVHPADTAGREEGWQEGFWSGLRLAGDDPRWMATPASAPRSPAVSFPERPPADPAGPVPALVVDGEPAEESRRSVWAALLATFTWYVVPALVLLAWILTLDNGPPLDCAADAAQRCESARAQAVAAVADSGPRITAALGASALIAVALRLASSWRAAGVGLAAAVIGGGVSTLVVSLVTGQPLG